MKGNVRCIKVNCRIWGSDSGSYHSFIFGDIAPCGQYVNRRFGGTYHLQFQGRESAEEEIGVLASG
jgi:hypothetical protein